MHLTTEALNVASETRELTARALDTTTNVLRIGTNTFNRTEEIFTLTTDNVRAAEQTLHLVTDIQSTTASGVNVATQNLVVTKQVHEAVLGVESRVEALGWSLVAGMCFSHSTDHFVVFSYTSASNAVQREVSRDRNTRAQDRLSGCARIDGRIPP